MAVSYKNYKVEEFLIESLDGKTVFNLTRGVVSVNYFEDLFSPSIFLSLLVTDTEGVLSSFVSENKKFGIRGAERVSLKINQLATGQSIDLNENNQYYVYKISNSFAQYSKEVFQIDLAPADLFKNETTRVFKRYPEKESESDLKISISVDKILTEVLRTTKNKNIDPTSNSYTFYGNSKRPFTVLTWLCPKAIPESSSKSGPVSGTAGFLFYENKNGYNFKSLDTLLSSSPVETYHNSIKEEIGDSADNTRIVHSPVFEKNVNVIENMRIGMYSSENYFLDLNTSKTNTYSYKLSENYNIFSHSSRENKYPKVLIDNLELENYPSRMMVKLIDNIVTKPGFSDPTDKKFTDDRIKYQSQSVTRYNLAFSQLLNITVPLNLNLTVGDVIELQLGNITLTESEKGLTDDIRSGFYLIKELCHQFDGNLGHTGLKLIRDSYGNLSNTN